MRTAQKRQVGAELESSTFRKTDLLYATGTLLHAFVTAFSMRSSISISLIFMTVDSSEIRRNRARSSMRFSRNESGLTLLRYTRFLKTSATWKMDPDRIFSEFSLKRSFQSFWVKN